MEPLLKENYQNFEILIYNDEDAQSPRKDWDNLGTMICFHNNYDLGDKHLFDSLKETKLFIGDKSTISLPLYLYDHSGITMNTTGFHCPWDSGQVGWIYIRLEKIKKEFGEKEFGENGEISEKLKEKILKILKSEVTIYDAYLTGAVYGYEIKKDNETIDSCWGFYGEMERTLSEAREIIDYTIAHPIEIAARGKNDNNK